jgi:hypothetical protein
MTTSIGELVADKYVKGLNMTQLNDLELQLLHAIKSQAVRQWAIETKKRLQKEVI